jgi:hypothetical protein
MSYDNCTSWHYKPYILRCMLRRMEKKTPVWNFFFKKMKSWEMIVPFWKMKTSMKVLATPFSYNLQEFSSFNYIIFLLYFYLGCGAPSKRVEELGLFNLIFLVGLWSPWDTGLVSGFLHSATVGCRAGMQCFMQVSMLWRAKRTVWAERICKSALTSTCGRSGWSVVGPFSRPSGRIQAHVRTPLSCAIGKSSQFCQNLQQL